MIVFLFVCHSTLKKIEIYNLCVASYPAVTVTGPMTAVATGKL